MNYKDFFKGKKVTLMGLGTLGRGIGDAKFLAEHCEELTVTDLKTRTELGSSIKKLSKLKNIKFVLGEHDLKNFSNADMVIKGAGVPLDSPFIKEALNNKVPVHMSTALFVKFFVEQFDGKVIGVTGTRGKTTITHMIYHILRNGGIDVILGGNIQGISTLSLTKKAKNGQTAILELDSWQLQGFGYEKISPHISVFTTIFPDHMNYYKNDMKKYIADKANIFLWQRKCDHLILGGQTATKIKKIFGNRIRPEITIAKATDFENIKTKLAGKHNKDNIACAIAATIKFGVSFQKIKKTIKNFGGVEGRLQLIKNKNGIKVYNDTTSTTPEAGIAAIRALDPNDDKNLILICGGSDKNLDMSVFVKEAKKHCKKIILLSGTGTKKITNNLPEAPVLDSLEKAANEAFGAAKKGDIVLFSPAFASFGMFENEYDRGDKFNAAVQNL